MVAPAQRRPHIWRGGILQIMVTRTCDLACCHCTQGSNLAGKPAVMTLDQFEQACRSLEGYFGVVGMFGGNPCTHPQFEGLCEIMRGFVPLQQRGLWTNNLRGKGAAARATFWPPHSNLNVHLDTDAYNELARDWPEAQPYVRGRDEDSIHSSPWVAIKDVILEERVRWSLIGSCDVNQHWSACIGVVRGELRAYFCELAYAQAALHADNPDWDGTGRPMPDTGKPVVPGWWKKPMQSFANQVNLHCHACGIPMRREGIPAMHGRALEYSRTHEYLARPKRAVQELQLIEPGTIRVTSHPATEYLPGVTPPARNFI
jgi:hypothetical protein